MIKKHILFYFMVFVSVFSMMKCYHEIFGINIYVQAAKKLQIEIEDDTEKAMEEGKLLVGKTLQLEANTSKVTYRSSDSTIACVNEEGKVTGKKSGTVVITAKKDGYDKDNIEITVVKEKKMPIIPVAVDEITIEDTSLEEDKNENMIFSARVKNHAKNKKIKKVILTYRAKIAEKVKQEELENTTEAAIKQNFTIRRKQKKVSLTFKNILAGEKSEYEYCEGDYSGDTDNMELQKIEVYSGDALHIYYADEDEYKYQWGTEDNQAPKITGWVKKDSVSRGEPFMVCYPDRKESYRFKQYVKAFDERKGNVKLTADTSNINWNKAGIYKIIYKAEDKAGNVAKSWAKIEVRMVDTVAEIADKILSSIIKESWSKEEKARAIYRYVKGHCTYVGHGSHKNWPKVATKAFRYGSGDCFTFYSMAKALLTRAGIPNVTITRYPLRHGAHHWWNLVYVKNAWYHFDTAPRSIRGYFCLVTDKQLREYRDSGAFHYVSSNYPERAKKAISHGCNTV